MKNAVALVLVMLLGVGFAFAERADNLSSGALAGRVSNTTDPLAYSKVYAYHLSEQRLSKVVTDAEGNFRFDLLPAGLYKVIAYKDGFVPAIALLARTAGETYQYLAMELAPTETSADKKDGFWAVREKIPSDILREIEIEAQADDLYASTSLKSTLLDTSLREAHMQAVTGMDQNLELGSTSRTGGQVGVEGAIANFNVGLSGNYVRLQPDSSAGSFSNPSAGRSQALVVSVDNPGATGVSLSTTDNYMNRTGLDERNTSDFVGLERHQVSWTQQVGQKGRSDFRAEYAEENQFFRQAVIEPFGIPDASTTWGVEGSYSSSITQNTNVQTGFRFRERQASYFSVPSRDALGYVPSQRVDLFGTGGLRVNPDILVEFGMYSTLRDGSLSLAPSGGMVYQLGKNWLASASGSLKVHEDEDANPLHNDFTAALFGNHLDCQAVEEYCYRLSLAHKSNEQNEASLGFVHRRFGETLHLYFNEDFFSRLESLYLVEGDNLPEVQFGATRRLSPQILAHLSSSLASGGGGILYGMNQSAYENEVSYLVTSLDTQFEQTSTGVFVAFHYLGQRLTPLPGEGLTARSRRKTRTDDVPEMEIERLQLMLTQDLDILHQLVSDWAVHLNMEVSRGSGSETESLYADDELRKRLMGGVSVSF